MCIIQPKAMQQNNSCEELITRLQPRYLRNRWYKPKLDGKVDNPAQSSQIPLGW